jgi:hypothetical protein
MKNKIYIVENVEKKRKLLKLVQSKNFNLEKEYNLILKKIPENDTYEILN